MPAEQVLIGLQATSRYGENLSRFLESHGYQLCLLHPRQTHQFAQQRGLRAKTDHLDATTIARVLLSGQARRGYVPSEVIATYRELVRLHTQLRDEVARYKNEIQALLTVLFPEFSQIFADPCRATALALLKLYPSAQAMAAAGIETIAAKLHELIFPGFRGVTKDKSAARRQQDLCTPRTNGVVVGCRRRAIHSKMDCLASARL